MFDILMEHICISSSAFVWEIKKTSICLGILKCNTFVFDPLREIDPHPALYSQSYQGSYTKGDISRHFRRLLRRKIKAPFHSLLYFVLAQNN